MSVVKTFLKKYNVRYIIVGKLEHAYNLDYQLAKFEDFNGALWKSVYRDGDTVIYEVDQNALMK
jgi:uncharacterized membrane protein